MWIRFALIAEGGTEAALVRILENLCRRAGATDVVGLYANELLALHSTGKDLTVQIRTLIECQTEVNLLFVHRDADGVDDTQARQFIKTTLAGLTAPRTVALVPVQETEAWLLTDADAIRRVAGNPNGRASLDLPKIKHIEGRSSPKELLRQVLVKAAKPGREQQSIRSNDKAFGRRRRLLLEQLDVEGPINELSAWTKLVRDIHEAVSALSHPAP